MTKTNKLDLKNFDFHLPLDHIARFPSQKRELSRLMMVDRKTGAITHHHFKDIPALLSEEDFLVVNNSKVIPVKLFGKIRAGAVEMLLVDFDKSGNQDTAEALTMPAKKFKPGTVVQLEQGITAEVIDTGYRGRRKLKFSKPLSDVFNTGFAPLPPYIKRKSEEAHKYRDLDLERYQTIYSQTPGSIAAPTAGLHFSPQVMEQVKSKCEVKEVTLSVGEATFQKIETGDLTEHRMGREYIHIPNTTAQEIHRLKETKNLIAVGTTSVRSLETYAQLPEPQEDFYSEIFIYPGYQFKMVDKLITNFHLPESSLFILTSAFGGLELMQEAYAIAIKEGYRFFSYGDAMFIK